MSRSEAEPDFDVIVVGAGIAGCVTAYLLAGQGHSVALLERGEAAGAKNLSGGVFYSKVMEQVFPDFTAQAPLERCVTRNTVCFVNERSCVAMDYWDERLRESTNAYTVLRARLDPWLAGRCEGAGVTFLAGVRVDDLLVEKDSRGAPQVVGVQAGDDVLRSRVVVAADGVNSFCATKVGLRTRPAPHQLAVGVKCVVELARDNIDERFGLVGDEGVAIAMVGDCTRGIAGGGFLYTNKESLSVGLVLRLDDLVARGLAATDVFTSYLEHPAVARYIAGGRVVEYGSHLVAEGGAEMIAEVAMGGLVVVGEAAGLALNTGLTVRGMDLAAGSARAAAQAIDAALSSGDTSRAGLAGYRQALAKTVVGADMRLYRRAPKLLERQRFYDAYGRLAADVLFDVYNHDLTPRRRLFATASRALKRSPLRVRNVVGDAIAVLRSI